MYLYFLMLKIALITKKHKIVFTLRVRIRSDHVTKCNKIDN